LEDLKALYLRFVLCGELLIESCIVKSQNTKRRHFEAYVAQYDCPKSKLTNYMQFNFGGF